MGNVIEDTNKVQAEIDALQTEFTGLVGYDPNKNTPGTDAFQAAMKKMAEARAEEQAKIVQELGGSLATASQEIRKAQNAYLASLRKSLKSFKDGMNKLRAWSAGKTYEPPVENQKPDENQG